MKTWLNFGVLWLGIVSLCCNIVTSKNVKLSDYLWQQTISLHQDALQSSFIQGLKNVSLDPTSFGAYMVQDSVYCYKVKGFLDIAASKETNDTKLKSFLEDRSSSYERYYKGLFEAWHIANANGIHLGNASSGYISHLQNVTLQMDPLYLVTALIPCARLWPWLGGEINVKKGNFGVYKKWVMENLDPDYHGYSKYEKVINAAFVEGRINLNVALDVYTRSMQGEVAFFSSV